MRNNQTAMTRLRTMILAAAALLLISLAGPALAGTLVQARCECGYRSGDLPLFGGRRNFESVCNFPAYCPGVKKVLLVNMFDQKPSNLDCTGGRLIPYDDPSLIGDPGKRAILAWNTRDRLGRDLKITDGAYLCPVCGHKKLRFIKTGKWD